MLVEDASEFSISKAIKKGIKDYNASLPEVFEKTQGKQFLYKHTKAVDEFIKIIYKASLRSFFEHYIPITNQLPITLFALGSYGREQLAIYSDIDLMIVYKDIKGYNIQPIIEKMLYISWDAGLKLGHRVHEVGELTKVVNEDLTIKTAILESRYICGSKTLFFECENSFMSIRKSDQKAYACAKIEEYKNRIKNNPINMEPNIKEGIGGMRDANTLYWILHILQNIQSISQAKGVFSEEEYKEFRLAIEFLFRVRAALHLCAGKKQDKLILDFLPCVSEKLGFGGKSEKDSHMQCARKTLSSMHEVHIFSYINLYKAAKSLLFSKEHIPLLRASHIGEGFYFFDNTLTCAFNKKIKLINLINILNKLPDVQVEFSPALLSAAKSAYIPKTIPNALFEAFKKLFFRNHAYEILFFLYDTKLLKTLIPSFKHIEYLPQFDGYHHYPVDIHSLECVRHLENIRNDFLSSLCTSLAPNQRAVLKLATLMHDFGKGRNRDHSLVGESIFKKYAQKLKFSPSEIEMGAKLIKNHLVMNNTASREDIYNEDTLLVFTSKVQNIETLNMLFLLTYADVNGVGGEKFTKFLERLLFRLYNNALNVIDKKELLNETQRRLKREQSLKKYERFNTLSQSIQKAIFSIKNSLFFVRFTNEEICDIAEMSQEVKSFRYKISNAEILTLEIVRKTPLNLGYLLGRLTLYSVASMDIYELYEGLKYFRIEFTEKAEDAELYDIEEIINGSFDMTKNINLKTPEIYKKDLILNIDHSLERAELRLNAKNQKGLLAYISKIFDDLGMDIVAAKIFTHKNRAKDMFLIEKNESFWNNKDNILSSILRQK